MRLRGVLILSLCLLTCPAKAVTVEEVTSPGGIKAWLVEDNKLPLIAMHFAFRGGVEQDPPQQQGLATLTMDLLAEGAGPYDDDAFQQQLADQSITMNFAAGRDALYGSVKTLASAREKAFDLLSIALTKPRFDPKDFKRMQARQLAALRYQLGNPDWQGRYALFRNIFQGHPYSERRLGSVDTLSSLTRADVQNFASQHLARDNLIVAVAGDITADELGDALDRMFGSLPEKAQLTDVPEVAWPQDKAAILVPRDGTQTGLLFALPGPKRDDPDYYAALIANYILGGGGFSSRLMQEVRDKNGLTYGISTGLSPMEHAGSIIGDAAVDNDKAGKAWGVTLATMQTFYDHGVTDQEVKAAKDYLTGALPLTMTSTDSIAGELAEMQIERLDAGYLQNYANLIREVSDEDIARVIQKWFNPKDLSLSMVGKPIGIVPKETDPLIRK